MSCLLFICFEALQGNQHSVAQQIICGANLLQEYGSSSAGVQSSLGGQIDEELSQIFERLEVQLRTFDDGRPRRYSLPRLTRKPPFSSTQESLSKIQTGKQRLPFIE